MITCSICVGSALIASSGTVTIFSSTSFQMTRSRNVSSPLAILFRSMIRGCRVWRRANASNSLVNDAARSPCSRIRAKRSAICWFGPHWSYPISAHPRIAPTTLLKSWAIPPASCPIASNFCACKSCRSIARNSVMSSAITSISGSSLFRVTNRSCSRTVTNPPSSLRHSASAPLTCPLSRH